VEFSFYFQPPTYPQPLLLSTSPTKWSFCYSCWTHIDTSLCLELHSFM
jgi:hypothetical protein